jgi:hypothetical protein
LNAPTDASSTPIMGAFTNNCKVDFMYPATFVNGTLLFFKAFRNISLPFMSSFIVYGGIQEINITFEPASTAAGVIKFVITNSPCIESSIGIFKNMPTGSSVMPDLGG